MSCLICTDDFIPHRFFSNSIHAKCHLKCCNNDICQNCLHSHIKSILSEGITGDGRKKMLCPFGCGKELTDLLIRDCIHDQYWSPSRSGIGYSILYVKLFLYYLFSCMISNRRQQRNEGIYYYYWMKHTKSENERNELLLYQKWSLTLALSQQLQNEIDSSSTDKTDSSKDNPKQTYDASTAYVNVVYCPRRDCECIWLSNHLFKKQKLAHEKKYKRSGKSVTKSIIAKTNYLLFYKPMHPNVEESIMQSYGRTTDHWLTTYDVKLNADKNTIGQRVRDGAENDGRYVICPKCYISFCGLCTRPWSSLSKNRSRITHAKLLCSEYAKKEFGNEEENEQYLMAANAIDARMCPGCSIRTKRSSGCNHMSCPCGFQWCYVCEKRWNNSHYSCAEGRVTGGGDASTGCIIS